MNYLIKSGMRRGCVSAPSSKSQAHRLLIAAALSGNKSVICCNGLSKDILATINCLNALGAEILPTENNQITVTPIMQRSCGRKQLFCAESGTTLRFLIPIAGALGAEAEFYMEGKLASRPLDVLISEVSAHGMHIRQSGNTILCSGKLEPGNFTIAGDISSQYVSGLLFALPLLHGNSTLQVTGNIESADYITMTENVLQLCGIRFRKLGNSYVIPGSQTFHAPQCIEVEQDWSNAAFFLCMGVLSKDGVSIAQMPTATAQGDMKILKILGDFGAQISFCGEQITVRRKELRAQTVDARQIPDLIPTICAVAAGAEGTTRIINAQRLKYKESNRLWATAQMLSALGADIQETEDGLIICGKPQLAGGTVDAANDHRIAMAAAVAASLCKADVTVVGAECVEKSYPNFWKDFEALEVCL